MINYKVFFYTVTFGISFSIIFCDWFFVTFSLGTAAQKKKHSQGSVKYFFQGKREAEGVEFLSEKSQNYLERERNRSEREREKLFFFVLVPAKSNTRKVCFLF